LRQRQQNKCRKDAAGVKTPGEQEADGENRVIEEIHRCAIVLQEASLDEGSRRSQDRDSGQQQDPQAFMIAEIHESGFLFENGRVSLFAARFLIINGGKDTRRLIFGVRVRRSRSQVTLN